MERPSDLVKQFERRFKNVWAEAEESRFKRRPKHGYLSLEQAEAIMVRHVNRMQLPDDIDRPAVVTQFAWQLILLSSWRMTKGIYTFHARTHNELLEIPLDETLPCAILQNLPEWCVYVETLDFVYESAPRPGYFFCVFEGFGGDPVALAWFGTGTIPIPCPLQQRSIAEERARYFSHRPEIEPAIHRALALTTYLCARNADIGDGQLRPGNPEPTKTKHGLRTFPREQVRKWDVGSRVGAELQARQPAEISSGADEPENHRARPRPHTRRAHEHHYWIKDENGERVLISRWIHNVNVNAKHADDLIETIRTIPDEGTMPANAKIRVH